jgi:hypothetical protein
MRIVALTMCFLAAASAAGAQERPLGHADLPRGVEARLTAIIEAPDTRKLQGDVIIAEPEAGNVVVYTGPATVGARIGGDLIIIDGDVRFEEGGAVNGDVTIVGGRAFGLENAVIGGSITMYEEGFSPFRRRDRVLAVDSRNRRVYHEDDHRDWGHSTFTVRTGWNYNRVEGLPIQFGPLIETGGRNPTRLEALAIWRTEVSSPFDTEDWGYSVRAEQFLGGDRAFRLGAAVRSVVDPIESWQMTKNEASLSTALLHSDYRDYYKREGWSAYARLAPRRTGLSAMIEYADETHHKQPARDPWTLFSNDDDWRLQPLVAEGRIRSVTGTVDLDRRNDDDFPTAGFLVRGSVTQGLGGDLTLPLLIPATFDTDFTRGIVDARVYRRVGQKATLSLRGVAGGTLTDQALPPQFQHALGGAGSLPGYSLFSADCGARRTVTTSNNDAYFASYGCDRMAMVSAEYRGGFDFHIAGFDHWDDDEDDDERHHSHWDFDATPKWAVFFDAGRGWAMNESKARGATNTGMLYDAGVGIILGDVGIYGAVPLTGSDRAIKFFIRLGPRF